MNNPIWKTSYAFDTTTISKCTAEDVKTRPVFQHANYYLSNNKPKDALELYTKILGEISPGHPVAFLNRSLCYLLLDFPSLAVIDACLYLDSDMAVVSADIHRSCLYYNLL
jgi:hypothetical protein